MICKDYVVEQLKRSREQCKKWYNDESKGDFLVCELLIKNSKTFVEWIIENGSEKSNEISKTILSKWEQKHARITDKQIYVISKDILERFKIEEIVETLFKDSELIK
jgi:hypothetical protein